MKQPAIVAFDESTHPSGFATTVAPRPPSLRDRGRRASTHSGGNLSENEGYFGRRGSKPLHATLGSAFPQVFGALEPSNANIPEFFCKSARARSPLADGHFPVDIKRVFD